MELILVIILIITLVGLVFIDKQERSLKERRTGKVYSKEEYLKKVMEKTNERLEQEQQEQDYKNRIKKNYLE